MASKRFSVVIPTVGRESLHAAVLSCRGAYEIIVCADGEQAWDAGQAHLPDSDLPVRMPMPVTQTRLREHGHPQRNQGIADATGGWLLFLDDDDVFLPGAISMISERVSIRKPHIFKMRYGQGHPAHGETLWNLPELAFCNVGTPMFAVPNIKGKLGVWHESELPSGAGGDFDFISDTCGLQGDPVFVDRVICEVRPVQVRD